MLDKNLNKKDNENDLIRISSDLLSELIRLGLIKPNLSRTDASRALEIISIFLNKKETE